ncbi:MAG TPA: lytic transglycosylase domain-containing protein [Nocardioides sp.]|nr:lytic transglycosylase domain-containing protein [Nocardioides sp.]
MQHRLPLVFVAGMVLLAFGFAGVVVWYVVAAPTGASTIGFVQPTAGAAPREGRAPTASGSGSNRTVSQVWVDRVAAKAGIPATAVLAYGRAQLDAPCAIGWTTLAGIGWVESQHGTIGGRTLLASGYSSSPITGPALTGGLDRAYGPMQFIPATWSRYATDGDGDGASDPNDIFDAAVATADYLCADGYDLATSSGWAQAIFSYNHSQDYVNQVYAAAVAYDQRTR